ncbi:hypothetical protein BKA62DRAFT_685816 [Auriculariales sp. MPI-PUGE-AT-0066]|nr:hypothetical protein BKA62DRAFT_685816 [Auriculariales sp. MPI-PUGE-AT-0066]
MSRSTANYDQEPGVGGWPLGYFMLRNRGNGRVFDVATGSAADGTDVILFPLKEPSRVLSLRDPEADNQIFFIDLDGNLCSKAAGHAVDVEGGKLVIRHRRPISFPFPNSFSHPLPVFEYSPTDQRIIVRFPGQTSAQDTPRMLVAVPKRRPRTFFDSVGETLTAAATTVVFAPLALTGLASPKPTSTATVDDMAEADFNLRDHELDAQDTLSDEDNADDDPERQRTMRIVVQESLHSQEAVRRTQWEVISILKEKVVTGSGRG